MEGKNESGAGTEVKVGEPMAWDLPIGAGSALESVGRFMVFGVIVFGLIAIYVFGRVPTAGRFSDGVEWSGAMVALVIFSTLWSLGVAFAVLRIGTALRWLEAIGKKHEITKG